MLIELGGQQLDATDRCLVMGILNVATDSPVSDSVVPVGDAPRRAAELRRAGASIIDVGAQSTRTGAVEVAPDEEIARVGPVVESLVAEGHLVSVDTWTASVARAAVAAGAHLINDITGADPDTVTVAVETGTPIAIMHMRGRPQRHREADHDYDNVTAEVRSYLEQRAGEIKQAGAPDVWIDPGFQFGRGLEDNLRLLLDLPDLAALGYPVLISASRKGFLAELLGYGELRSHDAQARPGMLEATIAFNVLAAWLGAHVVRVHDVEEVSWALSVSGAARQLRRSVVSARAR
ncbi:MAG: dihydropteroate synthase [Chloroflexi bacterium]|nr:dihydropteroate synthase [Chloroflexota bacterium]MYF80347.1 dihydropteroate synthase [Chloroflexota bacterium]MYI05203.1 dihydropteroate synthase [Chloroflexota bacterium]